MTGTVNSMASCSAEGGGKQPSGPSGSSLLAPKEFGTLIETEKNVTVLDVRTPEEFKEGHIPDAVNIDWNSPGFLSRVEAEISADSPLAVYCRSGRRSAEASEALAKAGYNSTDLEGGIIAWSKAGLPLTTGQFDIYTTPNGKTVKIEPLIHASLRIVFDETEIEVDPVGQLGNRTTDYAKFPKADIILVTHEHHDHLDPNAIKTLSKDDTVVIANPNSAAILGYGNVMKNGDRKVLAKDIEIEAVAAYNTSADKQQFHPKGRDNGYILTLDGLRIYIAGDTEPIPEMHEMKNIDIAFLPCNLPYTMTPAQFIEAAKMIMPRVVYPYHYGETDLSTITPALAPLGIYVRICPFDP